MRALSAATSSCFSAAPPFFKPTPRAGEIDPFLMPVKPKVAPGTSPTAWARCIMALAPAIGPPTIFLARPPDFMPPTCLMPSRSSLASFTFLLMKESGVTGLLPVRTDFPRFAADLTPSTLPPDLYARREMGRMPVFTSALSSSGGLHVDESTFSVGRSPPRRAALAFMAARACFAISDMTTPSTRLTGVPVGDLPF